MISNDEKKFYTLTLSDANSLMPGAQLVGVRSGDTTYATNSIIAAITQGTTRATRVGNQIRLQRIEWNVTVGLGSAFTLAAYPGGMVLRLLLVKNNQCNGDALAISDILDVTYGNAISTPGFINNSYTLDNRRKVTILVDKMCTIPAGTAADCNMKFVIPLHDLPIRFDGNAGAVTDLTKYDIQPFIIYSQPKGKYPPDPQNGQLVVNHIFRVFFTDN